MLEGIADLPLHKGHVPPWMIRLMKRMAAAIVEVILDEYGPRGFLERMSDPYWFQALNNVIGMDWDSSGSTTVTLGVLKAEAWRRRWPVLIAGGKGRASRRTPFEVVEASRILGLGEEYGEMLARISRLSAKVDSALLQDGYQLYHHAFLVSDDGSWAIIQQGMNANAGMARRYHWLGGKVTGDLTLEPHSCIAGRKSPLVLDLSSRHSLDARKTIVDLASENPSRILREYRELVARSRGIRSLEAWIHGERHRSLDEKRLVVYRPMPRPEEIKPVLEKIHRLEPSGMEELLLIRGAGPSLLRALALISDLIYNAKPSTRDPVSSPLNPYTYAYAVGGKDGVPYPYSRKTAEEVIVTLEEIIEKSRLEQGDKYKALKRLARIMRNTTMPGSREY